MSRSAYGTRKAGSRSSSGDRQTYRRDGQRGLVGAGCGGRKAGAARELKETRQQITALNRQSRQAPTLEEQHAIQEKIAGLERTRRRQRQRIFEVEDEVMAKRDGLISALECRMAQKTMVEPVFTIQWRVI